jgi:hypothetical protein
MSAEDFTFTISNADEDRDGDIVHQDGLDFSQFSKSPAAFLNHRTHDLPIGFWHSIERSADEQQRRIDRLARMYANINRVVRARMVLPPLPGPPSEAQARRIDTLASTYAKMNAALRSALGREPAAPAAGTPVSEVQPHHIARMNAIGEQWLDTAHAVANFSAAHQRLQRAERDWDRLAHHVDATY